MKRHPILRSLAALGLILALLACSMPALGADAAVETALSRVRRTGSLELNISRRALSERGIARGDIVEVTLAGRALEMPVVDQASSAPKGAYCVVMGDEDDDHPVCLAMRNGRLAVSLDIAVWSEAGRQWEYAEGYGEGTPVRIALKTAGGYEDYPLYRLDISNRRKDFPHLTDAQYANFRVVATTGMGRNVLYRSSSPVSNALNRNRQADAAAEAAGIRTVLNLANRRRKMKSFEGYPGSYYATLDVFARRLDDDVNSDAFSSGLAKALRFMIDREGPYLIHCKLGRDRTGFACAVLECLMGASAEEVRDDYMLSYYNFYGLEAGSEAYDLALEKRLGAQLAEAFGVADFAAGGVDLAACARAYLEGIGLDGGEIDALRARLAADIP